MKTLFRVGALALLVVLTGTRNVHAITIQSDQDVNFHGSTMNVNLWQDNWEYRLTIDIANLPSNAYSYDLRNDNIHLPFTVVNGSTTFERSGIMPENWETSPFFFDGFHFADFTYLVDDDAGKRWHLGAEFRFAEPSGPRPTDVPDSGGTLPIAGIALAGLVAFRKVVGA